MRSRILRTLVLACSLTFALPQGWCCMLTIQPTENVATENGPTCYLAGTAGCCCNSSIPLPGHPNKLPQKPVPLHNCPCSERIATLPTHSVEKVDVDLGFVAMLPDFDQIHFEVDAVEYAACSVQAISVRLHVLHCVWLC